jgi:hypothetical protein
MQRAEDRARPHLHVRAGRGFHGLHDRVAVQRTVGKRKERTPARDSYPLIDWRLEQRADAIGESTSGAVAHTYDSVDSSRLNNRSVTIQRLLSDSSGHRIPSLH